MPRAARILSTLALGILVGPACASAEWADWIAEGDVTFQYESNLNFSPFGGDEEDDFWWRFGTRGGRFFQLTDFTRASVEVDIAGEVYHEFDDLNAVDVGGTLAVSHKFGVGDKPWARLAVFGGYKDLQEDDRSGARLEVDLAAGKRFSPRFDASLSYLFTSRWGGNGPPVPTLTPRTDVWDQQYHLISAVGNFLVTRALLATVGFTFRTGEFDSACTEPNVETVLAKGNVKAIALDPVFGGCAYRLEGEAYSPFANLSYGITHHFSVNASYRFMHGDAQRLDYQNHVGKLTLVVRY